MTKTSPGMGNIACYLGPSTIPERTGPQTTWPELSGAEAVGFSYRNHWLYKVASGVRVRPWPPHSKLLSRRPGKHRGLSLLTFGNACTEVPARAAPSPPPGPPSSRRFTAPPNELARAWRLAESSLRFLMTEAVDRLVMVSVHKVEESCCRRRTWLVMDQLSTHGTDRRAVGGAIAVKNTHR